MRNIHLINALTAIFLSMTIACAKKTDDYEMLIRKSWEFERNGMLQEAINKAWEAGLLAKNEKSKARRIRKQVQANFLRAKLLVKMGKYDEANDILNDIYMMAIDSSDKARAIYEIALIKQELGKKEEEKNFLLKLIKEFPDYGLCSVALKKTMVIVSEIEGEPGVKKLLLKLLPDSLKSSFGDDVLWELAKLERKNSNLAEAEKYLLMIDIQYPYPQGGAVFDYLFMLAEIERERGNFNKALEWLEKIVRTAEKSYIIGDYNDDAKAKALIARGIIYLEDLKNAESAYSEFMRIVKLNWKTRSDDGLWWAAKACFSQGKKVEGCKLLRKIVENFKFSNFRREAIEALRNNNCSSF